MQDVKNLNSFFNLEREDNFITIFMHAILKRYCKIEFAWQETLYGLLKPWRWFNNSIMPVPCFLICESCISINRMVCKCTFLSTILSDENNFKSGM